MLRGLYTAASGLNAELLEQDVVANNIANANTVGFKKDAPVLEAFPTTLVARIHDRMDVNGASGPMPLPAIVAQNLPYRPLGVVGQGVESAGTATQFSAGSLSRTDQPFDFALEGDGLFTVQKADGSVAYTRAGNFTLNSDKNLATVNGDLVMGNGMQPIRIDGQHVVVDTGGMVTVDGSNVGSLALVKYDPSRFSKAGDNLYLRHDDDFEGVDALAKDAPRGVKVLQGFTEQSNVEVVTEMVHMISLMRAYEENTKAISMQDETLSKLITSVGTPSA
jgi:flagellar basal-body rod protein FlgG